MSDAEKDTPESGQQKPDTQEQTKPKAPPSRGRTFGGTGAEKRG